MDQQQENKVNATNEQIEAQDQSNLIQKDSEKCLELKKQAGQFFAENKFKEAAQFYNNALDYCPLDDQKMLCILNSNIAICQINQSNYASAIQHCTKALEFNPEFVKALLNRAECYEKTDQLEEALDDYKKLKILTPKDCYVLKKFIDLDLKVQDLFEKRKSQVMQGIKNQQLLERLGLNADQYKLEQNENGTFNLSFQS